MYWQAWSDELKRELSLDTDPVAVSMGGPIASERSGGKVSVCQALERAARGQTVRITAETCGCAGGLVSLGLGRTPAAGWERLVDFLVEREKVYCSRVALHRGRESVPPPVGVGSHVAFAPLASTETLPDIVVFLGQPGSLEHLIGLANYWEGGSLKAELAGPACRTVVGYPLVTGEVGISLLDHGARRLADFRADELALGIPLHRMIGIMHALAQGAGRGRIQDRDQMERQIDELGKVDPT